MNPQLEAALRRADATEAANEILCAHITHLQQQLADAQQPSEVAARQPTPLSAQDGSSKALVALQQVNQSWPLLSVQQPHAVGLADGVKPSGECTHPCMKRPYSDLVDEANERAAKAEQELAVVCMEKAIVSLRHGNAIVVVEQQLAGLRSELATAKQQVEQTEAGADEKGRAVSALQLELSALKQKLKLKETEAEMNKLKKTNEGEMETKWTTAKLEIAAVKKKMEEVKLDCEKKVGEMKQKMEDAEAEREKDPEYAALKKELKSAKFRHEVDAGLLTNAYLKMFQLKRDLAVAKQTAKPENNEQPKDDPSKNALKGCSSELISKIESDIVDNSSVTMDDIAGLEFAKKCINELIVWPMSRPNIFTGLRALPRGLLLFGPPGTGKTMIGKAIANESGATFFYISASSIASKWAGESERLVRTLFAVASAKQPSVIFIDEIDSMLTRRSDNEAGYRRAIKTEFMVQLDGMASNSSASLLVIGATNCPHTLDEAIRRRFVKRLQHELSSADFKRIAASTEGFSCADMRALCTEAALGPVREITDIRSVEAANIRAVRHQDFAQALINVKSSVGGKDLKLFEDWNAEFGSFPVLP